MSSNNINEGQMLNYIVFCFQIWGIDIKKQTLKKAKDNLQESCKPITKLLLELCLLDIFNFDYTIKQLGLQICPSNEKSEQMQYYTFAQQIVISYLSEYHCPLLQYNHTSSNDQETSNNHFLDFQNSRLLLIITGWLMAKIQFFHQIKNKLINKKFINLYVDKKNYGAKLKNKQKMLVQKKGNKINVEIKSWDLIQNLYKKLDQHQFRIQCLSNKKKNIMSRLSKQLNTFNKKNATNIKLQSILNQYQNGQEEQKKEQQELQAILLESNKSMKNQQYFWMWLQFKVIQGEFKGLQQQHEQFEKIEAKAVAQIRKINVDYLSIYNQQFKKVSVRLTQLNEYMESISEILDQMKPPKNQTSIIKQTLNDIQKILYHKTQQLVQQLGTPCFLKLQVLRYSEQFGYNRRPKKNKKSKKQQKHTHDVNKNHRNSTLKLQIKQFIDNLQQIKFI